MERMQGTPGIARRQRHAMRAEPAQESRKENGALGGRRDPRVVLVKELVPFRFGDQTRIDQSHDAGIEIPHATKGQGNICYQSTA